MDQTDEFGITCTYCATAITDDTPWGETDDDGPVHIACCDR